MGWPPLSQSSDPHKLFRRRVLAIAEVEVHCAECVTYPLNVIYIRVPLFKTASEADSHKIAAKASLTLSFDPSLRNGSPHLRLVNDLEGGSGEVPSLDLGDLLRGRPALLFILLAVNLDLKLRLRYRDGNRATIVTHGYDLRLAIVPRSLGRRTILQVARLGFKRTALCHGSCSRLCCHEV